MKKRRQQWTTLLETESPLEASVIQSKLESFDIPCTLKYESSSHLFGIMIDGLARVKVLVPQEYLELAQQALRPGEVDSPDDA